MTLDPIVSLDGIRDRLDELVLCDVRWYLDGRSGEAAYLQGHIPGALFVDLDHNLSDPDLVPVRGRHPWPPAELFAARLGALGIAPSDTVVAYDDGGGTVAGRFVFMLRAIGHDAALLDGGLAAWASALETQPTTRQPVEYPPVRWPQQLFADIDTVAQVAAESLAEPAQASATVIDVRSPDRYRGEEEPIDRRAGHIPGAVNLPLSGNTDESGFFLPRAELAARFTAAGVTDADTAIVHCGSGVSACQTLLAMEHAGVGRQRLFPGSWSEWSYDHSRPVTTGDQP